MVKEKIDFKSLRKKLKMSREQVAVRLGVSYRTVQRWESKNTEPPTVAIMAINSIVNESKKP